MKNLRFSSPETDYKLYLSSPVFEFQLDDGPKQDLILTLTKGGGSLKSVQDTAIYMSNTDTYRVDLAGKTGLSKLKGVCELALFESQATMETGNSVASASILVETDSSQATASSQETIAQSLDGGLDVNVTKSKFPRTPLFRLFDNIREGTDKLKFKVYEAFIDKILFDSNEDATYLAGSQGLSTLGSRKLPLRDADIYHIIKAATEAFLMLNAGTYRHGNFNESDLLDSAASRNVLFQDRGTFLESNNNELYVVNDDSPDYYLAALHLIKEKLGASVGSSFIDARIEAIKRDLPRSQFDSPAPENADLYVIKHRLQFPFFIELIWSYWHEESMLVQAVSAICQRFQNIRAGGKLDPLADMEITHLLPLNNVLWGYIQDEYKRLSVKRRAYEYDHHYGISLHGKAVPTLNSADSRRKFLEAFHNLLYMTSNYYKESANKLVEPDAFPLLNALRAVNFIIAEGMHNQYGDLPWTARVEMLLQQWMLSRAEFRNFLPGRVSVPYPEPWMDRVASMNKLQAWTDTSPIDFNRLAVFGEKILLSIRFGLWNDPSVDQRTAALWAEYFRPEIQGYIHSYKAATGVDLTATVVGNKVDARPPSYHLAKRLNGQGNGTFSSPAQQNGKAKRGNVKKEWM
jgi:hypothetical protein